MELKEITTILRHGMKNRSLTSLRSLISSISDPVFITENENDLIFIANSTALSACGSFNPEGEQLTNILYFKENNSASGLAFFDNRWLQTQQEQFYWNEKLYTKLTLKQISSIPDEHTLTTIRRMIAVLLHRLRSPMTGMRGYLEMVQDVKSENDKRKLEKVGEGLDYLFEIMDELELFHHADTFIEDEPTTIYSNAVEVIEEVLQTYPEKFRKRIEVINNTENHFQFNPTELSRILTLLLNNSTEHPTAGVHPIKIEVNSSQNLSITNFGSVIPENIVGNLFFPFVTTKANNLGIGLSLAQLIATRRRAAILLTENSVESGITFTLLCSPIQN